MSKAKEIHDRVYQIGGSSMSDGMDCSVYMVVAGNDDIILIDAGAGPSFPKLLRHIERAGFEPKRVRYLVLTHGHIDHIGGAPEFIEHCNCKVIAHEGDLDAIEGHNTLKTAADWYGIDLKPVKVDDVIRADRGEEVRTYGDLELHFMHTPGHTPGSMVVYVDIAGKRVLFGQDIHGPFDVAFDSDVKEWRMSMERLLTLEADILCEGHFGVYHGKEKVREFIQGYLDRMRMP
jgi:glyoxylase-like metal-dependent hydrolase (beta-lactamase superfamily II)